MNVLVTGGAGFLGSHLVDRLIADRHHVIVVDDLSTGRLSNLEQAIGSGRLTFIFGDLGRSVDALSRVLEESGRPEVDAIYHLASPASPEAYGARQRATLAVNALGTMGCVDLAIERGIPMLFASTSEVYGDPEVHPQPETYFGSVNPVGPRSCYDEGKRFGEAVVAAAMREHGMFGRIVRLFNAYGPRMSVGDGRLVPALFEAVEAGRPMPIHGSGTQTRSMTYVADVVEGVLAVMDAESLVPHPVNLGSHEERTVLEIAQCVAGVAGVPLQVEFLPARPEDPQRRMPDLSRARSLGWTPSVELGEGLRVTYEWFKRGRLEFV